jgi:hypothetical protein
MGNCEYGTRLHPVSEARILHHIPARRRHRGVLGEQTAARRARGGFRSEAVSGGPARWFGPAENR